MADPPFNTSWATDFIERIRQRKSEQPYDWQPILSPPQHYERRLKECAPPAWSRPVGSIDEARRVIRQAINDYLELEYPDHMLLIHSLPGTGKTTIAVDIVDQLAQHRRVMYAGPRHDLFQDVLAKSGRPEQWYEWLPRQAGDDETGRIQTCRYSEQITTWLNRGYSGMDFCSGVCGWDYVNKNCAYHQQKTRPERVIYAQHQHVTLGHPLDFSVLFGDESPLQAFTHEWRIPGKWIMPPGMDPSEPLTEILHYMSTLAQHVQKSIQGPELFEYIGDAQSVYDACQAFEVPATALAYGSIHSAKQASETPFFHLPALAGLLAREASQVLAGIAYPHRIIVSPDQLTLLLRRMPEQLPPHVVWLDATGRPEIYEKVFRRKVLAVDAQPRLFGKIHQVVDRANGKQATVQKGQRTAKAKQAETVIQKVIDDHGYQRPTIISYKDFVETTGIQAKKAHFYAARGTNEHEDADAIFILGAPQANIFDVVKLAKMLYFERDTAFKVQWCTQERPYSFTDEKDMGRCYPVSGFWQDPDLQAVLETIREDEIIQAAHRGRPVNHPVDIWLFTNVPIASLPPDELLTMREIMGAPEGVNVFSWEKVQQLMEEKDTIQISDITGLGLHYDTAKSYLEKIAELPGWSWAVTKTGKRGRPPKMVSRHEYSRLT